MTLLFERKCSMDRKDKSDELVEYTPEMQAALEMDDEKKLFVLMHEQGSHRHLAGYRLRPSKRTSESGVKDYRISQYYDIVSTPLLDILKKFPKVAGQIMYNLMSVNYVPKTIKTEHSCFRISLLNRRNASQQNHYDLRIMTLFYIKFF